jgi:hypothetical protein
MFEPREERAPGYQVPGSEYIVCLLNRNPKLLEKYYGRAFVAYHLRSNEYGFY